MSQIEINLLANSNAFKDFDNKIWSKETILEKIKKNVLAVVD